MNSFFYAPHSRSLPTLWNPYVYIVYYAGLMITSTTPYKLAGIIRDTWPGLYRPSVKNYNNEKTSSNEKV